MLWLLQAASDVPEGDAWLAAGERFHLATLRVPKRRRDWRLGRWTAKRLLAARLGLDPRPLSGLADLEVRPAADGAPEAYHRGRALELVLSLSHAGDLGLAAVAPEGTLLGCDVEVVEARSPAFVADYFTAAERERVAAAPAVDRPLVANLVWSAKESALKALRVGLRRDTRSVEVTLEGAVRGGAGEEAAPAWQPLRVSEVEGGRQLAGWWRRRSGFVLTLVAEPAPGLPEPALAEG